METKIQKTVSSLNYILIFIAVIAITISVITILNPEPAPFIINSIALIKTEYISGESLQVQSDITINKAHCDVYATRTIANEVDGTIVWNTISVIKNDILPGNSIEKNIRIEIPILKPGHYYYKAEIHCICGTQVSVTPTKLLHFKVS